MHTRYPELFQPFRLGKLELKNRFVMAPMASFGLVDSGGVLTDDGVEYFVTRARGGMGLIMTGTCFVEDTVEEIVPRTLMCTRNTDLWLEMQQFNKLARRIHAYGGKVFLQLAAGYGRSARIPSSAGRAVAPSPVPNRWDPSLMHREMTVEEIGRIVRAFGRAAAFAQRCGIDGVEVHAVHEGYLLDQFTMEYFNHRRDRYGGSFENRYRFAAEVCQEIKKACGGDFPVSLRYTPKHYLKGLLDGGVAGERFEEKGRDMEEGLRAARYLEAAGYDALNVDLGCYDAHYWNHPSVFQEDGLYLQAAAAVREAVSIPVIAAGQLGDPGLAARAVREGKCDLVALGRPSLADPEISVKLATGREDEIRPCVCCNYGCCTKVHQDSGRMGCAVNAQCGNELHTRLTPAVRQKRIVVVGGGPGGCECARVAALRGHRVTLLERGDRLGGALIPASAASFKSHDRKLIQYFQRQLELLRVDVRLNTVGTVEGVKALAPDVVVLANGAVEFRPGLPGGERAMGVTQALQKVEQIGRRVVILGAGQTGVETALWLLELGHEVTIVELTRRFMPQSLYSDAEHAMALLRFRRGRLMLETRAQEIREDGVVVRTEEGEQVLAADTVIFATGFRADRALWQEMREAFPLVYELGDAAGPRNIYHAVHEAYELAGAL